MSRAHLASVALAFSALTLLGVDPTEVAAETSPDVTQVDIVAPTGSERFGENALVLSNGNYVVWDKLWDDAAVPNVGAVYLYDGRTDTVISTLTGSRENSLVSSGGVYEVGDSNVVVSSPAWGTAAGDDVGAITWIDGAAGLDGVVGPDNSITGGQPGDRIRASSPVILSNGDFVVRNRSWSNGAEAEAGAVTWLDGNRPTSGVVSAANSLVGTRTGDRVGSHRLVALSNGHYVVASSSWANGSLPAAGAVTWGNGDGTTVGPVTVANSLVGTKQNDRVGSGGVFALTNGNYAVSSGDWANGAAAEAGAATWGDGNGGTVGAVSTANSLVGSSPGDVVSEDGLVALANGNYVVFSQSWSHNGVVGTGAITWADGTGPTSGVVSEANSLIGTDGNFDLGTDYIEPLPNGNFVVLSPDVDIDGVEGVGAVTWGDGTRPTAGVVSAANSLVGSKPLDQVGDFGISILANGNYVVVSPDWDNGASTNSGAVTWVDAAIGLSGPVTDVNSLVGFGSERRVGSGRVTALTNGNYLVLSPRWFAALLSNRGAVTWGDGASGITGRVSFSNSLVGPKAEDRIGASAVALTNGHAAIASSSWSSATTTQVGAVTWVDGFGPTTGMVDETNSFIGTTQQDLVGTGRPTPLSDGNFVIKSFRWDNGPIIDAGAATWVDGSGPTTGVVGATNSLVGNHINDKVASSGPSDDVIEISEGDFVVVSDQWDGGGAVTFGAAGVGPTGFVDADNSVIDTMPGGQLQPLEQLTSGDAIVITTTQDRLLLMKIDRPPVFTTPPDDVAVFAPAGETSAQVSYKAPLADDVRDGSVSSSCAPAPGSTFPLGSTTVTCSATDSAGLLAGTEFTVTVRLRPAVVPLEPARLLDTRDIGETVDGQFEGVGRVPAGGTVELVVRGRGGTPPDEIAAVVLNVTMIRPDGNGFVTVYPCDSDRPLASSMNAPAGGGVVANEVIAKSAGAEGRVCLYSSVGTHLAADLVGMVPTTDGLVPLDPARLLDTRADGETFDGEFAGVGRLVDADMVEVDVTGRAGVPADAASVVLNVTMIRPDGNGFVTIYPCGDRPLASSMNAPTAAAGPGVVANEVVAKVSPEGTVCLYSSVATNLAADVTGYVPVVSGASSLDPARLLDTRAGAETADGSFAGIGRLEGGDVVELVVSGRAGVPSDDIAAVVLNVTMIRPDGNGFVTVYPCGDRPLASSINAPSGGVDRGVVANEVIAKVSAAGSVCLYTSVATNLAADVTGYIAT